MNLDVLLGAFDRFVERHELREIWTDGLFGRDEERAERKYLEAWNLLKKLTRDGECRLDDGAELDFYLRKSCGLPTPRQLKFHKKYYNRTPDVAPHMLDIELRKRRNRERDDAATARLREIMRAGSTSRPQPTP